VKGTGALHVIRAIFIAGMDGHGFGPDSDQRSSVDDIGILIISTSRITPRRFYSINCMLTDQQQEKSHGTRDQSEQKYRPRVD
jgi:hypothetical protein